MASLKNFIDLPFKCHLFIGLFIRLCMVFYGHYHDSKYDVPFTDVDYKVFTDAARYVVKNESPFRRHTYRYSPIIAFMMTPNVFLYKDFGKIIYSIFDVLLCLVIKKYVAEVQLRNVKNGSSIERISKYCSLVWLYNPLGVIISSRGNADSFPCFVVVLALYILQSDFVNNSLKYVLSGLLLGVAIHLRLYPLVFSLPMYVSLKRYKITKKTKLYEDIMSLCPNLGQILLASSCFVTIVGLTYLFYTMYGYEFLFETYIYHVFRKDIRHNFSVQFYQTYLMSGFDATNYVKPLLQILQFGLLFMLSLSYGTEISSVPFALFCQAVVMVTFNSVMTSQYFVWFLSLLPLVVQDFNIARRRAFFLSAVWFLAQGAWLFYAYLLEFKSREVYIFIWLKGVTFFCANIYVLGEIIKSYRPGFAFGLANETSSKVKVQ